MYAIVEINGQQFKAEAGKKLFVHHIKGAQNDTTVEFDRVLLLDKEGTVTVGAPTVEGATVTAKALVAEGKGKKVIVFKYKPKKGYHKKQGHRQPFTKVVIEKINA